MPPEPNGSRPPFFLTICFSVLYLFLAIIGKQPGLEYVKDDHCFALLGCNNGFFGYDALEHVIFGIALGCLLIWIGSRYPHVELLKGNPVRKLFTVLAITALVGVGWECIEFSFDMLRLHLLHIDLYHPYDFAQPSNSDTMGDLIANLFGTFAAAVLLKISGIFGKRT